MRIWCSATFRPTISSAATSSSTRKRSHEAVARVGAKLNMNDRPDRAGDVHHHQHRDGQPDHRGLHQEGPRRARLHAGRRRRRGRHPRRRHRQAAVDPDGDRAAGRRADERLRHVRHGSRPRIRALLRTPAEPARFRRDQRPVRRHARAGAGGFRPHRHPRVAAVVSGRPWRCATSASSTRWRSSCRPGRCTADNLPELLAEFPHQVREHVHLFDALARGGVPHLPPEGDARRPSRCRWRPASKAVGQRRSGAPRLARMPVRRQSDPGRYPGLRLGPHGARPHGQPARRSSTTRPRRCWSCPDSAARWMRTAIWCCARGEREKWGQSNFFSSTNSSGRSSRKSYSDPIFPFFDALPAILRLLRAARKSVRSRGRRPASSGLPRRRPSRW